MDIHQYLIGQVVFINIPLVRPKTNGEVPSAHHEAMAMVGTLIYITRREQRIESSRATHHILLLFKVIFLMSLLITPVLLASSDPSEPIRCLIRSVS